MTIPDDLIDKYLSQLLGQSEPGATLHTMLTASASLQDRNAFGQPDPDKLEVSLFAIDCSVEPGERPDPDTFLKKVIITAAVEARESGRMIHFAGLAIESHVVIARRDKVVENRARRMAADRKLSEHEDVVEATRLYAACSDGRRWTGIHYLTGPQAGTIHGPMLRVGALSRDEGGDISRLIRAVVHGPA